MPKIKKECECCGDTFEVYPSAAKRRKTCSTKCGYDIQRAEHRKPKPCATCGEPTTNPKYCSIKCQSDKKKSDQYNKYLQGNVTSRGILKRYVQKRDGLSCCSCKLTEWMGKPITLWLDHINGNATDNTPDNLRLICPNCDSQNDTFGAKNIGNGRKSRGLKPWQ